MAIDEAVCDEARLARDARFDGLFFIGITSTGIYCRPICPSPRADRRNVRYFPTAAAAVDAGFRPCLRCRPEAAPGTPAWHGTSTTVSRALRLIADGALEAETVVRLSDRLGVSARHLDRLFHAHLGASPAAVARARRMEFAKQLITDSELSMSQVAAASGFQSVRRFNDCIKKLYRRTPSELRRIRPKLSGRPEDEQTFRLPYRPPYDWASLLAFLSKRAIPGVEQVASGAYRRNFSIEGRPGILEVRHTERGRYLDLRIRPSDPRLFLPIVARVRGMFDLAAEPAAIARHLGRDPLLGPLVRRYPGLRLPGAWDAFELAVRAILGQQVSVPAASTLAGRLVQQFGVRLAAEEDGGPAFLFPSAERLARVTLEGLPRARALAIRALARAVAGGRITFGAGECEPADLRRIAGIGDWTAQYIAMRALGHPDAFPADDLVLRRVAGEGAALTASALRKRAEAWRPWRAYAAMYLWRASADLLARQGSLPSRNGKETYGKPTRLRSRGPRRSPAGNPA